MNDHFQTPNDGQRVRLCQSPPVQPLESAVPERGAPGAQQAIALAALMMGAIGIGSSGIFVRLSETGPVATAFWRGALALPFLAIWALIEARRGRMGGSRAPHSGGFDVRLLWAGIFFAGDLGLWHWSLLETSVAASTLEANLAPIAVTLIAWVIWRERPSRGFLAALACAVAGVVLIMIPQLGHETARASPPLPHGIAGHALSGNLLGLATAWFYAGYLLVIARLRASRGAGNVMLWVTLVFTVLLLPVALTEHFLPHSPRGWAYLLGLALIAQLFGQGLIAYALAQLPATFGSVGLYVQPIAAAVFAWLLLGERLTRVQIVGALVVLGAIALARRAQAARSSRPARSAPAPS
ncbi:MAG: DMT family transporter [Steroidobacteraceae bacterium]